MFIRISFIALFMVLAGCTNFPAVNVETLHYSGEDKAYFILKMAERSSYIDKVVFHHLESKTDYKIVVGFREGATFVFPVPAGKYYLRRVDTHFDNWTSVRLGRPKNPLILERGSIYYLGDVSLIDSNYELSFSNDTLMKARKYYPDVFEGRDVKVLRHLFGG